MDKLIYLLNLYASEKFDCEYIFVKYDKRQKSFDTFADWSVDYMTDLYVVSKRFWFIERLIRKKHVNEKNMWYVIDNFFDQRHFWFATFEYLTMILSIMDNPIDFLIDNLLWWNSEN